MTPEQTLQIAKDALDAAIKQKKQNEDLIKSLGPAIVDALKPVLKEIADNAKLPKDDILKAIASIKAPTVNVPTVNLPKPNIIVNVPEIKAPIVNVPKSEFHFDASKIRIPAVVMPKEMDIKGWVGLMGVDVDHPLPVQLRDMNGKPVSLQMLSAITGGGGPTGGPVTIINNASNPVPVSGTLSATLSADVGQGATGSQTLRTVAATDSIQSVNIVSGGSSLSITNVVSTYNSTTSTLGSGAVLTGLPEDVRDYAVIQISVFADQVSATDGLSIQQSSDGTNWDITDTYTIPASTGKTYSVQVAARYYRLVYTNGATIQGVFRLSSVLHVVAPKGSSQRPGDGLSNENDFEQISAFIGALNASGNWDRLRNFSGEGNALRIQQATDSVSSTFITDTAKAIDIKQVSGAIDSVFIQNPQGAGELATALRITQAGDSVASVNIIGTVPISSGTTLISDQLSGAIWSVFATNPVSQGDVATALRVVIAGNSDASVVVNNPQNQGDVATALRVVIAGNSDASVVARPAAVGDSKTNDVLRVYQVSDSVVSTQIQLIARTTNPTATADGSSVFRSADKLGRALSRPVQVRDLIATAYVTLSTGTEATLLAGVAATFLDLIYIMGANTSNAAVQVDIRNVTAGNIVMSLEIPANGTAGIALPVPLPQDATGNNWTVDMPDITNSNVLISALFSKEI